MSGVATTIGIVVVFIVAGILVARASLERKTQDVAAPKDATHRT